MKTKQKKDKRFVYPVTPLSWVLIKQPDGRIKEVPTRSVPVGAILNNGKTVVSVGNYLVAE